MSFEKKHGDFIFNVQDHLVTCELIGPFNEEGMLAWVAEIKRVVDSLDGKRFCALVAIASLYSAQVLHHIALSCMSPIHPGHIQGFNSHQEAIAWLDAQYDSD